MKRTHDIKLAESLSPITKKLDDSTKKITDVTKESTQTLDVIKEPQPETPQLAIENTPTTHQPSEKN